MKLTFLGSGGAFTDFRHEYHSNGVLDIPGYGLVLIDCGSTAVQSMKELGIDYIDDLKAVLITHMHADHIGGLEQLIYERYYLSGRWATTPIYTHLAIAGDLRRWLELTVCPFNDYKGSQNTTLGEIAVVAPKGADLVDTFYLGQIVTVEFSAAQHCGPNKPCCGVSVRSSVSGVEIFWSGDTEVPNECRMDNADLVVHECSFGSKYPSTVHTHLEDLKNIPVYHKEKTILTHCGPVPEGIQDDLDGFAGVACRGMYVEIAPGEVIIPTIPTRTP
jgi:ribonuclease BN (tRNA processing enzyme)